MHSKDTDVNIPFACMVSVRMLRPTPCNLAVTQGFTLILMMFNKGSVMIYILPTNSRLSATRLKGKFKVK